ncbi:MAG: protein-export chaperone SecB [Gammaproteobacteria bacterium]|nr:protein-export chaperone SecB [Gammaproteobacteria bacterium]MCH9716743.1 protein-export chaperone SecB [Gammaproteobacteria bacterium]MCH9764200.1 protein-export chaperone SecB [Gammaproteobacteria bacterium]
MNDTAKKETQKIAETEAQFVIQRVYVKNLSFETNSTPAIFQEEWTPDLNLDLNTAHTVLDDNGTFEVVLTVTATVKNKEKTAFLIEVQQAGIFTITGTEEAQLDHLLGSFCPSLLFPYAREAISTEVVRGSFPQLVLAPINFDAIYMQQQQDAGKAEKTDDTIN